MPITDVTIQNVRPRPPGRRQDTRGRAPGPPCMPPTVGITLVAHCGGPGTHCSGPGLCAGAGIQQHPPTPPNLCCPTDHGRLHHRGWHRQHPDPAVRILCRAPVQAGGRAGRLPGLVEPGAAGPAWLLPAGPRRGVADWGGLPPAAPRQASPPAPNQPWGLAPPRRLRQRTRPRTAPAGGPVGRSRWTTLTAATLRTVSRRGAVSGGRGGGVLRSLGQACWVLGLLLQQSIGRQGACGGGQRLGRRRLAAHPP